MSREFALECVISNLAQIVEYAVAADLGEHFISELKHLVATAKANRKEETK